MGSSDLRSCLIFPVRVESVPTSQRRDIYASSAWNCFVDLNNIIDSVIKWKVLVPARERTEIKAPCGALKLEYTGWEWGLMKSSYNMCIPDWENYPVAVIWNNSTVVPSSRNRILHFFYAHFAKIVHIRSLTSGPFYLFHSTTLTDR